MTPHVLPTPGWLARQAGGYGQEMMLCLLGAGLLVASADGDTEVFYTECAAAGTFGVKEILRGVWADFTADYPYLAAVAPLTNWLDSADPAKLAAAGRLAGILADVDIVAAERALGGDLLGRVYDEMLAINRRLRRGLKPYSVPTMMLAAYRDRAKIAALIGTDHGYLDGACLSGVRPLAAVVLGRALGWETDKLRISLNDPDPTWTAIAAVNFAEVGHRGPIEITNNPALVSRRLYPDKFTVYRADDPEMQVMGQAPDGWDCVDWELAVGEAQDREELLDEVAGALAVQEWVRLHQDVLTGHTLNDLMAGLAEVEGGVVDDTTIDYGPRRATRPRVKRKKRVRGRRR